MKTVESDLYESGLYIGLMSGTSLDGVDAVLCAIDSKGKVTLKESFSAPFDKTLRQALFDLQKSGPDEIHRENMAANQLALAYAKATQQVLEFSGKKADEIKAIGAHGQTIRHRHDLVADQRYSHQTINAALLAETVGIDVIADFRARDLAAGGQGAPLVPSFHAQQFASANENRVVLNLGGIANLTFLPKNIKANNLNIVGLDCGPGNVLMDAWITLHRQLDFDSDGQWASSGKPQADLLESMLSEPYFQLPAPKSTGRDLFNLNWIEKHLEGKDYAAEDVQASLLQLTLDTILNEIQKLAPDIDRLIVCGGGSKNITLMQLLQIKAKTRFPKIHVTTSATEGIDPQLVESLAFAWLAWAHLAKRPANLPAVTGAKGSRILGAHYPR